MNSPYRAAMLPALVAVGIALAPGRPAAQTASPSVQPSRPRPQPDTRRWDIEVHRGFGSSEPSGSGSGRLPDPGESFNTIGGSSSRRVPSWYFGDGAGLLNSVLASFGRQERITALDSVLTTTAATSVIDSSVGIRVTRRFARRLTVEMAFERAPASYAVVQSVRDGLKATSDTFTAAFGGIVASGQGVAATNPVMSSTFATKDGTGAESLVTGALVMGRGRGRLRPYVAVGGGVAISTGSAEATATGRYAFTLPSGAQVDETDAITLRFGEGTGAVALLGVGLSTHVSAASGVRLDARVHFVQRHVDTTVSARPIVVASLPADALWSNLDPGIQFVTNPSTNHSSSLNGSLDGFRTLTGTGFEPRVSLNLGYFFRF